MNITTHGTARFARASGHDRPQRLHPVRCAMAALAALMLLAASPVAAQTSIDLTVNEARALASRALLSGEPALALQIAQTLLAQNPDDRDSLVIVAAAAPRLGDAAAGRQAGARAWGLSETDTQKYEAARLTALAAVNEERFTLATFWLRRALTVAPNAAERARTTQDARAVTRRNPWSTQLSFSLVPSNNVNGGAEDATSTAPGNPTGTLSEDALALSGWRGTLSFGTQYRIQENQRSRTLVGLQYQIARVRITEDTTVPDEAFNTAFYEVNIRHDRVLENGSLSLRAARGTYEYRDLDLGAGTTEFQKYDIRRFGLDRQIPLSDRLALSVSVTREWLDYLAPGIGEVDRTILGTGLSYQLDSGDRLGANFSYVQSEGDSVNYTSDESILSVSYGWSEPFGPISLSAGGGFRWTDYPDYRLLLPVDGGRQDTTAFVFMNVGFPQIEYAGFTPGLRIDASQADSNVSRFDRTTFAVGLTINSTF